MKNDRIIKLLYELISELRSENELGEDELARARMHGHVLETLKLAQNKAQANCNHRKGGYVETEDGGKTWKLTNGNDPQFAVMKHQLSDGSWLIRCLRCGKEWKKGDVNYEKALVAPTRNISSTSMQFNMPGRVWNPLPAYGTESDNSEFLDFEALDLNKVEKVDPYDTYETDDWEDYVW